MEVRSEFNQTSTHVADQIDAGPVHCESQDAGPSQSKCEQANTRGDAQQEDQLSISSNCSENESQIYLMRDEIINNMMLNINDEDVYLDQFRQLLKLEDYLKEGNHPYLPTSSFDPTISIITPASKPPLKSGKNSFKDLRCKTKKSKVNIKNESCKHTTVDNYDCAVHYAVGRHDDVAGNKPSFVCQKEERILKRCKMFSNPRFNLDLFDSHFDELIDLEESFIA